MSAPMLFEAPPQCKTCRHTVRAELEFRPMRDYFKPSALDHWQCADHRACMTRWEALMAPHLAWEREIKLSAAASRRANLSEVA